MSRVALLVVVGLFARAAVLGVDRQPAPPSADVERVADVARYLKDASEAWRGKKLPDFPTEEKGLWERARCLYSDLHGERASKDYFARLDGSLGSLEDATFQVLREVQGPKWYVRYLKHPTRP